MEEEIEREHSGGVSQDGVKERRGRWGGRERKSWEEESQV